jgi:ketosteroid isomerase-like protein
MGEALDVARRHYEAFQAEDWDGFFALYDPDVEVDLSRSGIPDGGIHHGHEGLRRRARESAPRSAPARS